MKWLGAFTGGLITGIAAALALLYFNPLGGERVVTADATSTLSYELGPNTLSFTYGDQLGFDLQPRGVAALWESTIRRTLLASFVMRDEQGNAAGVASRVVKLSRHGNPLILGVLADEHWLVTIPGEGSFFIESTDNVWPLLRDTLVDVNLLRRTWRGTRQYQLSAGPEQSGAGRLIGASGRFAGSTGTAVHVIEVRDYARMSQLQYPIAGRLQIDVELASGESVADSAL